MHNAYAELGALQATLLSRALLQTFCRSWMRGSWLWLARIPSQLGRLAMATLLVRVAAATVWPARGSALTVCAADLIDEVRTEVVRQVTRKLPTELQILNLATQISPRCCCQVLKAAMRQACAAPDAAGRTGRSGTTCCSNLCRAAWRA